MTTREIVTDGWRVRLDTSAQVLGVEVPEFVYGWGPGGAEEIRSTLPSPGDGPGSAATLLLMAKQFDDGLVAAVEVAARQGVGRFGGKTDLLRGLAGRLGHDPAAVPVLAPAGWAGSRLPSRTGWSRPSPTPRPGLPPTS